ncbi:MAG: ABC-2 transporter permease [Candidatus Merdivicinus sp.]|jgi:ABC-2 type transport system permease protein
MIGLICKDFYTMRGYLWKQLGFMVVIYLAISLIVKSTIFLSAMTMMLVINSTVSTFALDENAKWNSYALTLPLTPAQIVLAKYLYALLSLLICGGSVTVLSILVDSFTFHEGAGLLAASSLGIFLVYQLTEMLTIPIYFKVGVEKARLISVILYVIPFFVIVGILPSVDLTWMESLPLAGVAVGFAGIVIAASILSYLLSVQILSRKEF